MRREIVLIARDLGAPHWPALTARLILSQHTMLIRRERCRANSASKLPRLPLAQPKDLHPKEKMPIATPVTRLSVWLEHGADRPVAVAEGTSELHSTFRRCKTRQGSRSGKWSRTV